MSKIIKYENVIVSFLDILGFKNIVLNSSADKTAKILKDVEYFTKPPKNNYEAYEPIVHIFSDTIIRIRRVESEENRNYRIGLLVQELSDLMFIQAELIEHKVLLRGAVSYGEAHFSKTQVFGPAIVRAYELENRSAIYPRIILDPILLQEFEKNILLRGYEELSDESEFAYSFLKESEDGYWFIDYLRAIGEEVEADDWVSILYKFKELIIEEVQKEKLNESVIQKYMWLARYLNKITKTLDIEWFEKNSIDMMNLFITEKEFPYLGKTETLE